MHGAEFLIGGIVADGDGAKKEVAVTADVLGEGLHRDVHAVGEGVEVNSCGPGVIEDNESAGFVSDFGDGRDVLDFHGDGARAFAPDKACILLQERMDLRADSWRVEADFDAETAKDFDGEFAIWRVNAFGDENVIAGFEEGKIDERDGGLTARRDKGAIAIFEFADASGEFECGGRAVETVGVSDSMLVPGVLHGGGIGEEDCGAAMGSRGKRGKTFRGVGVGMDKLRFPSL